MLFCCDVVDIVIGDDFGVVGNGLKPEESDLKKKKEKKMEVGFSRVWRVGFRV